MALCTQDDVENKLQVTFDNDPDAVVASLIADAQAHIEAAVGRTLESDTRTETFDGGHRVLFLRYFPVTGVDSVTEDSASLTVDDDFMFYENGMLIRVANGYPITWKTAKSQAIDVTYTGGYLTGTHDAELEHLGSICSGVVARAFRKGADAASIPAGAAGQIQSISIAGSDSVTYATGGGETTFAGGLNQFVSLLEGEHRQLDRYRGLLVV